MAEQKRIFVVDPSAVWRKILIGMLEAETDFLVAGEIGSRKAALLMLEEVSPDLVLMAYKPSEQTSVGGIITQMQAIKPGVKVILCVDKAHKDSVVDGMSAGVSDFVTKPYAAQPLFRTIRECLALPIPSPKPAP